MFNDSQIEILNVEQACEILYCCKGTLYDLLRRGELKGFLLGRSWKIPEESLKEYIRKSAGLI